MARLTRESVKNSILYGGIDKDSFNIIKSEIVKDNRHIVFVFSALVGAMLEALFVVSHFVESLSNYSALYGACFFLCGVVFLIALKPGKNNPNLMTADMYLFCGVLFSIGIALGTVLSPLEVSAAFIALLLAVPQVFSDKPWRMYLMIVAAAVLFIVLARIYKSPDTAASDITNTLAFGIVSIVLYTYSVRSRIARYWLEYRTTYLAENDQLTGLKNRHSFQYALDTALNLNCRKIYCVYIDANGLHELNDTQGHEAGDRMLKSISDLMRSIFGKDVCYRVGGDEFIVLGTDREHAELEDLVKQFKAANSANGYCASAGICVAPNGEIDVEEIVKEAEKEMYADKAEFYRSSGHDRRRRR